MKKAFDAKKNKKSKKRSKKDKKIDNNNSQDIIELDEENISFQNKELDNFKRLNDTISKAREYYLKIWNNYNEIMGNEKLDFYMFTYYQREKIVSDYLIKNSEGTLPGISYKINNQLAFIQELNNRGITNVEIKNLYNILGKNNNDFIIGFKEIKLFVPQLFFPEYNTFIIFVSADENKGNYYFDHNKKILINLSNQNKISFDIIRKYKYYLISFVNINSNNNEIESIINAQ